jgi:hypothetical protein
MSEVKRNEGLLKLYRQKKRRQEGEKLLELLPQGEGSGLDADKVDGLHAEEIIEKAQIIVPASGSGGGAGMSQHGNEYHTPDFALVRETHITFIAVASEVSF